MFKKPAALKPATPLRSSSRRAFLAHLQQLYPILNHATPEHVQQVVPNTLKQHGARTSSGEKAVIYTDSNGTPLWLELGHEAGSALLQSEQQRKKASTDRLTASLSEVIPTLYAVWLMPQLLPRLPTWPQIVDPVLLGGSALMIPGLIPEPNTFPRDLQWPSIDEGVEVERTAGEAQDTKRHSLVCITAYPSTVPMAIARLEEDVKVLVEKRRAGEKGKAAVMLHCKGDALLSLAPKGMSIPSDADLVERQVRIKREDDAADLDLSSERLMSACKLDDDGAGEDQQAECERERGESRLTVKQVDEILYVSLLMALTKVTDEQLPLSTSAFYSGHILPNRPTHWPPRKVNGAKKAAISSLLMSSASEEPETITVADAEIRQSSFKKLSKWLKLVERKGLIKVKEVKGKDPLLTSFDRRHPDIIDFSDYLTVLLESEKQGNRPLSEPPASNLKPGRSTGNEKATYAVRTESFWRAGPSSVKLFQQMSCPTSVPLTRAQIRQALLTYITSENLINPHNKALVNIADPHLTHALFPKAPLNEIPPSLRRDEILDRLLSKSCNEYHRTSRLLSERERDVDVASLKDLLKEGESIGQILVGPARSIRVEIKTRQGRKVVSLITNLESYAIDADTFAGDLMRIVGASASASPLPGSTAKNPKNEVFVQGDQRKAIVELLETQHGLDKRLIQIDDMTKK